MNNPQDIDYKNNLFEHPELTRIVGEPTTATLITLQAEIRDNAQAVQTDLGGGANGHLGLVCADAVYQALVPGVLPYVRPANPGRFAVAQGNLTQFQLTQARAEHAEETRVFREILGVERAIIQQMVVAVEPKYIRALRNPGTNKLNHTIPEILDHLFTTYGDVTPSDLRELTLRVESLSYPPSEPVDSIFVEIDDLAAIAEIAGAPITATQKINMAYIHFQKCLIFKSALNKWDDLAVNAKTWAAFKTHFREAHKSLRRTGALTINDTLNREQVMNMVSEGVIQTLQDLQPPPPMDDHPSFSASEPMDSQPSLVHTDATSHSINSTVSDITMQSLQRQMELMQSMMMQCLQGNSPQGTSFQRSSRQPTHQPRNPNQSKYCWTHGWCSHFGRDCRSKSDGHRDEATKNNRMGGSTKNILPQ